MPQGPALLPILPNPPWSAALSSIAALLCSVVLLIGGNALVGVTAPLRARLDGVPEPTLGLLG